MKRKGNYTNSLVFDRILGKLGLSLRSKLITTLLVTKIIPILLLTALALYQVTQMGTVLREMAVEDSSAALNAQAVESIERITTDTAWRVADFLYDRDSDILFLASMSPSAELYRAFIDSETSTIIAPEEWVLSEDGTQWVPTREFPISPDGSTISTNVENNDMDGFHFRSADSFSFTSVPLYDEITFINLDGIEMVKVVSDRSTKENFPMSTERLDVSVRENTYVKAETYWETLKDMQPGEIYVSDVIGAYVPSNFIGMYTPDNVASAAVNRGYDIPYLPEEQSYAGAENPYGQHFEGIVRWATPVADANGEKIGYVTFALNHDHLMEFVDRQTPMSERYTELPSATDGNYSFIWDYKCRSICHPRHNSIYGYDPETGYPQVPWLESSIYDAWQASGVEHWQDYIAEAGVPEFDHQSRDNAPAPELTRAGLVGLDGRYLNNAPQCTGWMDLTADGGSGSFYILWSGVYKLTTAAAIPYYTGQYAPSEENNFSRRGFGIVTVGAGLEDFTQPAVDTSLRLEDASSTVISASLIRLLLVSLLFILLLIYVAVWLASYMTGNITDLVDGMEQFRSGYRQFRFHTSHTDEFGDLANSFDEMADSIEDSVKNPLIIIDMNRTILYANVHWYQLMPQQAESMIGSAYASVSLYPPQSEYDPILALQQGRDADIFYHTKLKKYCRGIANYFSNNKGENVGYIIETIDLTELETARRLADEANHHKGDFLARMSHEIRTPMNAIIGLTALSEKKIQEGQPAEEVLSNIQQIDASSQHLLGLINDILDISKIEAGKLELSKEPFDLNRLIETTGAMIRPRCEEKNINFVIDAETLDPAIYIGDSLRLRQVLINLLGNAVKFTPELGVITLSVVQESHRGDACQFLFSVKDTGVGITQEAADAIFRPFEQADNKVARRYGGTGLGLSISQSMVQMMGGEIQLDSAPGEGSNFFFRIWFNTSTAQPEDTKATVDLTNRLTGKRILIVDDVDVNRLIVSSMLEESGATLLEASDGDAAVDMFAASPIDGYDLILMDLQMPTMDGYEAAATIRAMERPDAASVPIVALTANAFQEDIKRVLDSGMNGHVAKPVELDVLSAAVAKFIGLS